MIPFDKIPNDLRSNLFFSEITVNGNAPAVVDSSTDPNPPIIGCEGAIQYITFGSLDGVWDVQIYDDLYDTSGRTVAEFLQNLFEGYFLVTNTDGVRIENLQSGAYKFKLIPKESTSYIAPIDNSTFLEHEDGSLTFCLSSAA